MEFTGAGKICSFCGEPWTHDLWFAGGFGAQICRPCVHRYSEMMSTEAKFTASRRPPWVEMSDEELLDALPNIVATSAQVDDFLHGWVHLIRERGISWQHIGLALGVSRQAAWERFRKPRVAPEDDVKKTSSSS